MRERMVYLLEGGEGGSPFPLSAKKGPNFRSVYAHFCYALKKALNFRFC